MSSPALFTLLSAAGMLMPGLALGQRPVELAMRGGPQPHFVAAWAPEKEREAERSAALAGRVSLELVGVSLDEALKALTNMAGLNITYSPAVLPAGKRVTIKAGDIAVVTALTEMLFRSGLDVVVDQDGTLALVPCKHVGTRAEVQDSGTIVGTVTDKETGAPIAGATVTVEEPRRSATTVDNGSYRIEGVESGIYTVRARYIGYAVLSTSVTVTAAEDVMADFALQRSVQVLDEVVTTGTLIPTEVKALPTPISVITEDDIELQRPNTVQALLRQAVPTAVAWGFAQYPNQTAFSARGAASFNQGAGQMKVYIDGLETANPGVSAVDPNSIERIEVIRGPQAAAIYGSEAIGGVIQIFTKRGERGLTRPQMDLRAALGVVQTPYSGQNGALRQDYKASIRGGGSDFGYGIGAGYSHTGDYLPNGEVSRQSNPSIYGGMRFERGVMEIDASGRYYTNNNPNVYNPETFQTGFLFFSRPLFRAAQTQNLALGTRITLKPLTWWRSTIAVGLDRLKQEAIGRQPRLTTPADTLLNFLLSDRSKASISANTSVHGTLRGGLSGSLTIGFDHYSNPITSFSTFGAGNTTGTIRVAPGFAIGASRSIVNNTGYFAQTQLSVHDALFLTGGLRAEQNTDFGDSLGTPLSPRVGFSYVRLVGKANLKIRGSYGSAIRAPSPGLKFAVAATNVILANPLLGPERQKGWDAGLDAAFGSRGSLSITYYDQTAEDLIQAVVLQAGPPTTSQFQNIGRVRNTGVEVEGALSVGSLQLKGQYGYARSRIDQLAPNYTGDLRVDDQSPVTPKHTAGASLAFNPLQGTTIVGGLTYVGSWDATDFLAFYRCLGNTGPCRETFRDYTMAYPGLVKINASITQQITHQVSAFASVDNLTNNTAYEFFDLNPVMGRITTVGARLVY